MCIRDSVGTVLAKTFAFPLGVQGADKLIETRLLVHAKTGWVALPYIWDNRQNDATLQLVPDPVPVKWTDRAGKPHDFTYVIPNANECRECHEDVYKRQAEMTRANRRTSTSARREKKWACADEMEAQRDARPRPWPETFYKRPEDRKRETGSATGCRLNTQRATAKPRAA